MSKISTFENISESIKTEMEIMHQVREIALSQCRTLIHASAKCIRHIHRREQNAASQLLIEAKAIAAKIRMILNPHPRLLYAGYLQDAEKEMVEACLFLSMIQGKELESVETLGVDFTSYLHGAAEAASECRRYILEEIGKGHLDNAKRLLDIMIEIYEELITFDYADSLTKGLRRTTDALRAVLERTQNDLLIAQAQDILTKELQKTRTTLRQPIP